MNNLLFLEGAEPMGTFEIVGIIVVVALLVVPWIYILFKFGIFRRLRIRFFVGESLYATLYFKKNDKVTMPADPIMDGKKFVGWYINPELTEEYIDMPMPDKNLKLFAKFIDK